MQVMDSWKIGAFDVSRLRVPAIVLFAFIYVFGFTWLFYCRYGVNDNGGILEYIQNGLPIAFTGVLLTKLLHLGYTVAPDVPWFGLWLYTMHALCVSVWLWIFSRAFRPWWLAGLLSLALLGYEVPFLLYVDYTATAAMLCGASLAWVLLLVLDRQPGRLRYLAPGILFMLGALTRPQVPLGSLFYAFPLALLVASLRLQRQRPLGAEICSLIAIGLIFFAPVATNLSLDAAYRHLAESPQQMQFDAFNAVRGKLDKDLTRSRKRMVIGDDRLLGSLHWTRLDAVHIFNWNFLDERVDTVPVLRRLLAEAPLEPISAGQFIGMLRQQIAIDPYNMPLFGSIIISLLLAWRRPWPGVIALLAPLYCIVGSSLLALFLVYTDRTEGPLVLGYGFASLTVFYYVAALETKQDRLLVLAGLMGAVLAGLGAYSTVSQEAGRRGVVSSWSTEAQERLDILNRDYAGQIILMDPNGAMPIFKLAPLKNHPIAFQPIELGWNTFSPLFYRQIGKLDILHGYELVDTLITHHAYALGSPYWYANLQDYVGAEFRPHLKVTVVRQFDDFNLYQFSEEPARK